MKPTRIVKIDSQIKKSKTRYIEYEKNGNSIYNKYIFVLVMFRKNQCKSYTEINTWRRKNKLIGSMKVDLCVLKRNFLQCIQKIIDNKIPIKTTQKEEEFLNVLNMKTDIENHISIQKEDKDLYNAQRYHLFLYEKII